MELELIVTTMHRNDFELVAEMNIQSNAIICNQCGVDNVKIIDENNCKIILLSTSTIGKSINQNLGIIYSSSDILLFSDDDLILCDDYKDKVINFFETKKDADAVKFYCESLNPDRPLGFRKPKKSKRVSKLEMMSAGTPMLAVRREFLIENNLWFNCSIGPGTKCPNGEDGVFISDLFRKKAKVYVCSDMLATIKQSDSSWFQGFNEDYFINSGYIYKKIYGLFSFAFIVRKAYKFYISKKTDFSFFKMISLMKKGSKSKK